MKCIKKSKIIGAQYMAFSQLLKVNFFKTDENLNILINAGGIAYRVPDATW